ncbi:MAG: hypothetical protein WDZ49_16470 [Litorilinea sp.]
MTQQRITFEWRIGEAEYDRWADGHLDPNAGADAGLFSTREQRLVNNMLRGLALLTVVVLAATGISLSPRQLEWDRAAAGIQRSLDRENRAWYSLDRDLFLATVDPTIEDHWATEWRRHWRGEPGSRLEYGAELQQIESLGDGFMRVAVTARQPATEWSDVEELHELRFYRETEQGWVRTVPGLYADYWGERRTLQTGNLHFIYFARDADTVRAAAPRVAAAMAEIHRLLDIDPPVGYEEFTVELQPDRMGRWAWDGNHVQITSPTFATVPAGLTPSENLTESLVNRLAYRVFNSAEEPDGRFLFRWTVMNWGLRRWMITHLLDQPSPWHAQAVEIFRTESAGRFPLSPREISDNEQAGRPSREYVVWRFLAAETLIEYGVQTYGEQTIPALFRGFTHFASWEELTPAVYGVDLATFTAGWNEYLAEHYQLE